jgi:hypothetical protein
MFICEHIATPPVLQCVKYDLRMRVYCSAYPNVSFVPERRLHRKGEKGVYSKQLILKKGGRTYRTWRKHMENQNKIHKPRTLIMLIPTFSWSFLLRLRCLICMQYLFCHRHRWIRHHHPPFFCKLWNTFYREIINIMTIMMKTIKKRLNLYTKNILMGWGPVYF